MTDYIERKSIKAKKIILDEDFTEDWTIHWWLRYNTSRQIYEVFLLDCKDRIDDYDYKEIYENAYNSIEIDKLKTNKEELYEDILDILKNYDMETTNRQLAIKYDDL